MYVVLYLHFPPNFQNLFKVQEENFYLIINILFGCTIHYGRENVGKNDNIRVNGILIKIDVHTYITVYAHVIESSTGKNQVLSQIKHVKIMTINSMIISL